MNAPGPQPRAAPARYGPHCGHDGCGWLTCGHTGFVEHPCRTAGCPWCGAPDVSTPEAWATMPPGTTVAVLLQPGAGERVAAYLQAYPYGPGRPS